MQEKKSNYHKYLQTRASEDQDIYKQKRNPVKHIIREARDKSWNRFISNMKDDVHGHQMVGYLSLIHI